MNIYGDTGNIITLQKRMEWRGITVEIKNISVGNKLKPKEIDIFFFGGGQDQAQELVARDLFSSGKGKIIKQEIERGIPLLAICGGYQLLGDYYQPHQGPKLSGVSLFPAYTIAGNKRMIGNIIIKQNVILANEVRPESKKRSWSSQDDNRLVGFENHSGKTYLKQGATPLGKIIKGFGNNGGDKQEGCIYKNAIGTYMHGSLLPKNPQLADWLLQKTLELKYEKVIELEPLNDEIENKAHNKAIKKFS